MHSFNGEQVHFDDRDSLPKNVKKYWNQRYNLFSKYDEGIYMNHELWFSVTPENLAIFIAKFVYSSDPSLKTICDVFCGGGGNIIQFARKFDTTIGIDFNETNLYCTRNNCEVYGVSDKVQLKLGSWIDIVENEESYFKYLQDQVDMVFASPPWGGPNYKNQETFDLNYLEPLALKPLLESFLKITKNVALFLPRNSDIGQLAQVTRELLGNHAKCRIIYAYTNGYIKGMLVFWGDIFTPDTSISTEVTAYDEHFYDERPAENYYSQNQGEYYDENYGDAHYGNYEQEQKNAKAMYQGNIDANWEFHYGDQPHIQGDQYGEHHHEHTSADVHYDNYINTPPTEDYYEEDYYSRNHPLRVSEAEIDYGWRKKINSSQKEGTLTHEEGDSSDNDEIFYDASNSIGEL